MLKEFYSENNIDKEIEDFLTEFDQHSDFFRKNFLNIVQTIATKAPILHSSHHGGFTVVSGYEPMREVATNTETYINESRSRVIPSTPLPPLIPTDLNGQDHAFWRTALNPLFSPARMKERKEAMLSLARALLEDAAKKDRFDIIEDYAKPLTGITSLTFFGIDATNWREFDEPITNSTFFIGSPEQRAKDFMQYQERVREAVKIGLRDPQPGTVLAAMKAHESAGRKPTPEECFHLLNNLIIGGLGTTQAVTGTAAVYLARNPDRRRELIEHPERMAGAVNEFLRLFSSAPLTGRSVVKDTTLRGHAISANEPVALFWAAGNYDPAFIDRPLEVDFQRNMRSTTFALGSHMCLGQHLARAELAVLLETLIKTAPDYQVIDEDILTPPDLASALAYVTVPARLNTAAAAD
ncbi:cytochrome P450 [Novosphingobium sp. PASSN1]|uniref:cytochrome P450 n=1 Tax=Novosphingobium sp. PASSN1 TaxID=2015561 RepID=UPI000BCE81BC|nr:cytochrome P450 [Novosphingobium sp. PASSN1]OYU34721.1 MAG: hypothetical protein CFE35_12575 [Novosphingobium sp. PASSN1]